MNIEMTKAFDKKKIAIISGIVILIAAIIIGIVFLLATVNGPTYQNNASKTQAEKYKNEAISAYQENKLTKAKELYEKALEQYRKIGDTVGTTDMEAQIYIIEHSDK